ncbi:MAG TPA: hypothetical protein IAB71_05870 [Candidatus Scatomonas pullistercoris]|uniref:Uncharacterized protein n=1 Tax=Candidatus Scatomonas pullistercoris TaxID=2840920 RepID=A0A9D1TAD0_9FIRM|nr:hypothetical protein [Candidatus Scatomonas pullistercoris]
MLKRYTAAGILFTAVLGTLTHFCYQWSGENPLLALVVPVSESTWEHMKMLFFPMLLWSLLESALLRKKYPDLFWADAAGILTGLLLIPAIFYTYSGILGRTWMIADILLFYVSILAGFLVRSRLARRRNRPGISRWILLGALLALLAAFFLFTWNPPAFGIFRIPG